MRATRPRRGVPCACMGEVSGCGKEECCRPLGRFAANANDASAALTRFEYPTRRPARSTKARQDNARPAQIWTIGATAGARSC